MGGGSKVPITPLPWNFEDALSLRQFGGIEPRVHMRHVSNTPKTMNTDKKQKIWRNRHHRARILVA